MNHWSKYNDNLKNVKVEGDTLMDLQKFWNTKCTTREHLVVDFLVSRFPKGQHFTVSFKYAV